jgi:hypothetical protein
LVMDCTEIGADPPILTLPTDIWRVFFRLIFEIFIKMVIFP